METLDGVKKMTVKIKWEVSPAPTGRYKSFQRRGWPVGRLDAGNSVILFCKDTYVPANIKTGNHSEITVMVDVWNDAYGNLKRVTLKKSAATLKEAKEVAASFFNANPQYIAKQNPA